MYRHSKIKKMNAGQFKTNPVVIIFLIKQPSFYKCPLKCLNNVLNECFCNNCTGQKESSEMQHQQLEKQNRRSNCSGPGRTGLNFIYLHK